MNETKFYIEDNKLMSRDSGAVPEDEPVFIFRARDIHACVILEFYKELLDGPNDDEHRRAVDQRLEEFYRFRHTHPERMKNPDTNLNG